MSYAFSFFLQDRFEGHNVMIWYQLGKFGSDWLMLYGRTMQRELMAVWEKLQPIRTACLLELDVVFVEWHLVLSRYTATSRIAGLAVQFVFRKRRSRLYFDSYLVFQS